MNRLKALLLPCALLLSTLAFSAETGDGDAAPASYVGGWEFLEIHHDFKNSKWFITDYIEHDNIEYRKFDCAYNRFTIGYRVLPWLSAGLCYDFMVEPGHLTHRAIAELSGALKSGNFKVSIRERYMHTWRPDSQKDELRSRLKVQYYIPDSSFSPYLAMEVFTWGVKWMQTRHYVACDYKLTPWMQLEWYYMYYAFKEAPAEHVIGIGLNFDL